MDLPDNNILINAFRPDAPQHAIAKDWLENTLSAGRPLRLFPTVEAGFLRIVTHQRIFDLASSMEEATAFLEAVAACPSVESVAWSESARREWMQLCMDLKMSGNDCNDAMLAAVARDKGLRLVTFDKGFQRFPKLDLLLLE